MTLRDPQLEIDAFVDGRMSADERRAFEQKLQRLPELSREVEARLEIRRAMRDDPSEVSIGFHSRARASFEQRGRGLPHLLSAEFIGLAAAVALAAVFFLPTLVERKLPGERTEAAQSPHAPRQTETEAPVRADQPAASRAREGATEPLRAEMNEGATAEEAVITPSKVPSPVEAEEKSEPGAPAPTPAAAAPSAEVERLRMADLAPPSDDAGEPVGVTGAGRAQRVENRAAAAKRGAMPAAGGVALTRGLVGPSELRIERGSAERARLDVLLEGELAALGGTAPGTRVALIGPRAPGFSCHGVVVRDAGETVEIVLGAAAGAADAAWGCAVVLADDGRPIVLIEADDEDDE